MTYVAVGLVGLGIDPDVQQNCPGVVFGTEPTNDFCPFERAYWSSTAVYVMRIIAQGMPKIETTSQALRWASAYGDSLLRIPGFGVNNQDVRGLVFRPSGPADEWTIDVVVTTPTSGPPLAQRTAAGMIEMLNANAELRSQWPEVKVLSFTPLELLKNKADWQAGPTIWSWQLFDKTGTGKTEAYGRGEGVWKNGTAAHPQAQMVPRKETPIVPPPDGPPGPPPPGKNPPVSAASTVGVVFGVVLVAAVGWVVFGRPQTRKATP